jgi:hypothetical protein
MAVWWITVASRPATGRDQGGDKIAPLLEADDDHLPGDALAAFWTPRCTRPARAHLSMAAAESSLLPATIPPRRSPEEFGKVRLSHPDSDARTFTKCSTARRFLALPIPKKYRTSAAPSEWAGVLLLSNTSPRNP